MADPTGAGPRHGGAQTQSGAADSPLEAGSGAQPRPIRLSRILAQSEQESEEKPIRLPPEQRVGYAVVGLGRLALEEILPAFGDSELSRPVALVSGDPQKAAYLAQAYGIDPKSVYDYQTYDRLRDNESVDVVYIALPNSMHREFTVRAAEAGKHVLCEKPMANSSAECLEMIAACEKANRKLMIAYRMQYEPYNREMIRLCKSGELGQVKLITAVNAQNQGDPGQWRLKKALAGGGALPDIGIYCLNAARYLTGEEPIEVRGFTHSTPGDPRFREVEETVDFVLRFQSGVIASCSTSYGCHTSRRYRVMASDAWAELDPGFSYRGLRMRTARRLPSGQGEEVSEHRLPEKNQFALELDHMSLCVLQNRRPQTPGEEGLQDMRLIEAIYRSAQEGRPVELPLSC